MKMEKKTQRIWFGPAAEPTPEGATRALGMENRAGMPCLLLDNEEYAVLSFEGIAGIKGWVQRNPAGGYVPAEFLD